VLSKAANDDRRRIATTHLTWPPFTNEGGLFYARGRHKRTKPTTIRRQELNRLARPNGRGNAGVERTSNFFADVRPLPSSREVEQFGDEAVKVFTTSHAHPGRNGRLRFRL